MGEVVFSHAARYRMGGAAPSVVARPLRVGPGARSFEHAAASRLGNTLDLFGIPDALRSKLISEAEDLGDITNLNPAMLAAAQVFFNQTRNKYSNELFRSVGKQIVAELERQHVIEARDDDPEKDANMLNLLRYICIIGNLRGIRNLPALV